MKNTTKPLSISWLDDHCTYNNNNDNHNNNIFILYGAFQEAQGRYTTTITRTTNADDQISGQKPARTYKQQQTSSALKEFRLCVWSITCGNKGFYTEDPVLKGAPAHVGDGEKTLVQGLCQPSSSTGAQLSLNLLSSYFKH